MTQVIRLSEWNIDYKKFVDWCISTGTLFDGLPNGDIMLSDEACVMFKLTFSHRTRKHEIDTGYYYAPYIPLLTICPSSSSDSTT